MQNQIHERIGQQADQCLYQAMEINSLDFVFILKHLWHILELKVFKTLLKI